MAIDEKDRSFPLFISPFFFPSRKITSFSCSSLCPVVGRY